MKFNIQGLKGFIAGTLITGIIASTILVNAETTRNIQATFGNVKIFSDGKQLAAETLLYNGTTYVPLRSTADAIGVSVTWDQNTNSVYLNNDNQNMNVQYNIPLPQGFNGQPFNYNLKKEIYYYYTPGMGMNPDFTLLENYIGQLENEGFKRLDKENNSILGVWSKDDLCINLDIDGFNKMSIINTYHFDDDSPYDLSVLVDEHLQEFVK